MNIQQNIANNIRKIKTERKLTLDEYAVELGIARSSLMNYLNGTANPRADTIELLAESLNVSPGSLISAPQWETERQFNDYHPLLRELVAEVYCVMDRIWTLSELLNEQETPMD